MQERLGVNDKVISDVAQKNQPTVPSMLLNDVAELVHLFMFFFLERSGTSTEWLLCCKGSLIMWRRTTK